MKVSVIIPTRNMGKLLENTLNSLVLQKTKDVEIIVVDDDSSDETKHIIKEFGDDIKYYFLEREDELKVRRVSEIRNFGASKAKGNILIFLDADMVVQDGFIEEHLKSHQNVDVVLGLRFNFNKQGNLISEIDKREPYFFLFDDKLENFKFSWILLYSHNFSVSKKAYDDVNGFSTYFDRWGCEDQELGYKLLKKGYIFSLNKNAIAHHQYHMTEFKNSFKKRLNIIHNTKDFFQKYKDNIISDFFRLNSKFIMLDMMDKCNNRCVFCKCINKKGNYISLEDIKEDIKLIDKDYKVIIKGSEPLLHPDFFQIIEEIQKNEIKEIELETNGRAFDYKSFCAKCINFGINNYSIHIFGHNEKLHDKITEVNGSFNQTISGIKNLVNLNQGISIELIITKDNFELIDDIIKFYKKLGIDTFCLTSAIRNYNKDLYTKIILLLKKYPDLVFKNVFFKCLIDLKNDNFVFDLEMIRNCTKCDFLKKCKGKPKIFFNETL
ncbi:glycosyltransferase [Candidatus Woesearchaeota archaeon]|jgi:glycosyltransferase involved in cell wall biosynthesis/pyruvate-formate lyase-activating enzyme|nr:glycosyltransferase [Candidatus Woesearchaeota archaeon]